MSEDENDYEEDDYDLFDNDDEEPDGFLDSYAALERTVRSYNVTGGDGPPVTPLQKFSRNLLTFLLDNLQSDDQEGVFSQPTIDILLDNFLGNKSSNYGKYLNPIAFALGYLLVKKDGTIDEITFNKPDFQEMISNHTDTISPEDVIRYARFFILKNNSQ